MLSIVADQRRIHMSRPATQGFSNVNCRLASDFGAKNRPFSQSPRRTSAKKAFLACRQSADSCQFLSNDVRSLDEQNAILSAQINSNDDRWSGPGRVKEEHHPPMSSRTSWQGSVQPLKSPPKPFRSLKLRHEV